MSSTAVVTALLERDLTPASDFGPKDAHPASPRSAKRRRWYPTAACLASYVAISILIFLPIGPFDSRHLPIAGAGNPAGNDPYQMVWFLSYVPYAITHGLSLFHTNFIDYPRGVNLTDNTSVPLLGIASWPITSALGPIASFNFLLRLSFALSGASMFLVLRRWCVSWEGPFVGGLLYALSPYMAAQELHLDLIFVPIPPLLVLFGDEFVRRQQMSPRLLGALIAGVSILELLTSPDILSGCAVIAVTVGLGLAIKFRRLIRARLAYMLRAGSVAFGLFAALAAYPIYDMLFGPAHISGPVVPAGLLQSTRADLFGAITPTSNQLLTIPTITSIGNHFVGGNLSENGTYIGIPLLILLFMIVRRQRRNPTIVALASAGCVAWVLSLGSHLSIGGWSSPIPLPEDLLTHLPLLDNTIPARYGLYVILFASMLVGIGVERMKFDSVLRDAGKVGSWPAWSVAHVDALPEKSCETPSITSRAARWTHGTRGFRAQLGRLKASTTPGTRDPRRPRGLGGLRSSRARLLVLAGIVGVSLLPNIPFVSRGVPWPTSLPGTINSFVPEGSVVLAVPFTNPSNSEAMAWQAVTGMHFRLIGGYANVVDPGKPYGQRQPPALQPTHVQELLGYPKLGYLLPWVSQQLAGAQLLTYLDRYSVDAVVFRSRGSITSPAYWYLTDTLGQPEVVQPGYAIWLPKGDAWKAPAPDPDYTTNTSVTPDQKREHVF